MDGQPTQAQGQGQADPPPPPPPPAVAESQSQGGEDDEEEEEAKNEDDELMAKAQKLMEKTTASPDNPSPAVLHALASLLETQEARYAIFVFLIILLSTFAVFDHFDGIVRPMALSVCVDTMLGFEFQLCLLFVSCLQESFGWLNGISIMSFPSLFCFFFWLCVSWYGFWLIEQRFLVPNVGIYVIYEFIYVVSKGYVMHCARKIGAWARGLGVQDSITE